MNVGYGGQGGMGDIALHPDFATNGMVYLSYVESAPDGTRGAAVGRGRIDLAGSRPSIAGFEVLWRQYPKMVGYGHYGHRLVFDDEGYCGSLQVIARSSHQLRICRAIWARCCD